MSPLELAAVGGMFTAVVGAITALLRFRPDADSVVLTQAQGAATILNDLVQTLNAEVLKVRQELLVCQGEGDALRAENKRLRALVESRGP